MNERNIVLCPPCVKIQNFLVIYYQTFRRVQGVIDRQLESIIPSKPHLPHKSA